MVSNPNSYASGDIASIVPSPTVNKFVERKTKRLTAMLLFWIMKRYFTFVYANNNTKMTYRWVFMPLLACDQRKTLCFDKKPNLAY